MNRNLPDALRSLAHAAGETSSGPTALALANRSVAAVERHHRRRPVLVAGLAGLGVLTAGAAAALGYSFLQDDDAAPFPDRLTPETTMPSSAPVAVTCGAGVGDLVATIGPLELGSEAVDAANDSPVTLSAEPGASLSMYVRNASADPVTIATTQGPVAFLVQDGRVVAIPAPATDRPTLPADSTLAPGDTRTLTDDGVVACPDASGATPAAIPTGDYDAYGVVTVGLDGRPDLLEVVGGPWPVSVDVPAVDTVAPLPVANPGAVAPQCGAAVDQGSSTPAGATSRLHLTTKTVGVDLTAPGPVTLGVTLDNRELSSIVGEAESAITLVLVRDGIVVGRAPDAVATMTPYELDGSAARVVEGTLWIEACGPAGPVTGHLPAGRYDVWALHRYTVTARTFLQEDFSQSDLVATDEAYDLRQKLTDLWIDESGQPTPSPAEAAGMPSAIDLTTAMDGVTDVSVVWLALPTDEESVVDAASAALTDLGYGDGLMPFMCQEAAQDAFGADDEFRFGAALIFATRADADRFTEMYQSEIVATIDGDVFCDFD